MLRELSTGLWKMTEQYDRKSWGHGPVPPLFPGGNSIALPPWVGVRSNGNSPSLVQPPMALAGPASLQNIPVFEVRFFKCFCRIFDPTENIFNGFLDIQLLVYSVIMSPLVYNFETLFKSTHGYFDDFVMFCFSPFL